MTANEFKKATFAAYIEYVALIEGRICAEDAVKAIAPVMREYGFTLTVENLINTLTVKMTSYGKTKGETARKVKSITTFRAFIKGGWAEVESAPVLSNAGKNPNDATAKSKSKKPTKAELEAQITELRALLAAQAQQA